MTVRLWSVFGAVIGSLAVMLIVQHAAAQRRGPLTVTRLYTGPDGQTHAEDVPLNLAPRAGAQLQDQSGMFKAVGARFVRAAPGYYDDWHHPQQRQYLITISGHGEIEIAGGQKVQLLPGRILLVEDLKGKGHRTRTIGSEPRISVDIPLEGQ
jgi:quercetin dioxygenase-like cupin family protein